MPRPASVSLRFLRSLVAVVTVWCTGCSGFEPVLGAIAGEGAQVMSCASESMQASNASTEGSASSAGMISGSTSSEQTTVSAAPRASSQNEFSCGCSSCHAVELAHGVIPTVEQAAPIPVVQAPSALMSVGRTPLLPPPERTAL